MFTRQKIENYSKGAKEIISALEALANPQEVKKNLQLMVDEKKKLDESISKYNKIKSIEKNLKESEEKNNEAERILGLARIEADKLVSESRVKVDALISQATSMFESKKAEADRLMAQAEEESKSH